jgi:uncharacterized protein with PIN domain
MNAVAMIRVLFRFHGDLKDLLAPGRRHGDFEHAAGSTDTAKHVIESLRVPHTEVGRIAVNGITAALDRSLEDGDRLDVYPPVPGEPLDEPRFVLDGHLGRLNAYLRMLGLDVWYRALADDIELASVCAAERRLLLTRDVGLLKRKEVERGYLVRADRPHDQLREVARRYSLQAHVFPFSRCMSCNGLLQRVSKEEVLESLPPHTRATKDEFSRCTACGKVYWKGSHHARMQQWIAELLNHSERSGIS